MRNLSSPGSQMSSDTDTSEIEVKIHIVSKKVTKTLKLNTEITIFQICENIQKNVREAPTDGSHKTYGLFLPHEDERKGLWLDNSKTLQHYIIRKGDIIEYRNRQRYLRIRTMDGVTKKLTVDDSWTVAELMLTVCSKLGIYNYDEYSLISESTDLMSPNGDKTLSMKRNQTLSRDQEKLDRLKRKYNTEDGLNWLNPSQSLRQQGVLEKEVLLVKRKYFYSDMNVDKRDPIQLSLLYVQLKDAVINGTHPVTLNEAIELAGIQCQVQFGDFMSDKHKTGFLDLTEFLPKEYLKSSRVEKKIYAQFSKHKGLQDVEAKENYCLLCRSLKTYGITFFLVKEKVLGKNKLIPRLLGVNKDSVVQVDEKTKDIIQRWNLTSIKHWAASFNGFTLDFGEYSPNGYYTAQTDKGEKISQLISGYIDIILKKKKAKDHLGMDADEESIMYEENISPLKAVIVEHVPKHPRPVTVGSEEEVVMRKIQRTNAAAPSGGGSVRISSRASDSITSQDADMSQDEASSYYRQVSTFSNTQSPDSSITTGYYQNIDHYKNKQYVISLNDNLQAIEAYKKQMNQQTQQPIIVVQDEETQQWLRANLDSSRQRMSDEIGAMNAAVAQLLRSAQGLATITEEDDEELHSQAATNTGTAATIHQQNPNDEVIARMQNSFSVIAVHLPSLLEEINSAQIYQSQLGEQDEDENKDLISAARLLADAFTNLIQAAYPIEEGTRQLDKQALIEAAANVGEVSSEFLSKITEQENSYDTLEVQRPQSIVMVTQQEQMYREELLRLAKCVANATTNLIKEVKVIAVALNSEEQNPEDTKKQKEVVQAATQTGASISQFIATTKIVAPTIEQPVCQEQLILSVDDVADSVQNIVISVHKAAAVPKENDEEITQTDQELLMMVDKTDEASKQVEKALDDLRRHIRRENDEDRQKTMDNFMVAYEKVLHIEDQNNEELIEAARKLAQATAGMIGEIKTKIEEEEVIHQHEDYEDDEDKEKMITAMKELTKATTYLVDSAKNCSAEPEQYDLRYTMREAADRFILVTYSQECGPVIQEQIINSLLVAARTAATASTHLINTSQAAAKKSRASNYKVSNDGQELSQEISKLIVAIKEARSDPKDQLYQLELIEACKQFLEPSEQLCQSSRFMWPTVTETSLQTGLGTSIEQAVSANEALKKYLHQANLICRHIDLNAALKQLERLLVTLETTKSLIEQSRLIPLPDEKAEESTALLIRSVKQAGNSGNRLKNQLESRYPSSENEVIGPGKRLNDLEETGKIARELSSNLSRLVKAARGVAASIELDDEPQKIDNEAQWKKDAQLKVTDNCRDSIEAAHTLITEASRVINTVPSAQNNMTPEEQKQKIHDTVIWLSDALNRCFDSLPGQRDLEMLSKHVEHRKHQFIEGHLPPMTPNHHGEEKKDITDSVVELNQAVNELVAAQSFTAIQRSCKKYRASYDATLEATNDHLNNDLNNQSGIQKRASSNEQARYSIVDLSDSSIKLFECAKHSITEQDDVVQRKQLHEAARSVIDALNLLLNSTSRTSEPGQKECDKAIMKLESMRPILDNPIHPISHKSYYECLEFIIKNTMPPLADSLKNIPVCVKDEDHNKFVDNIYQLADNICWMLEETAQTAYLIGIGDGSSKMGKKGLADHGLFLEIRRNIQTDCRKMVKCAESRDYYDEDEVAQNAVRITENAKSLCEAGKTVMASYPRDKTKISEKMKISLIAVNNLMTSVQKMNNEKTKISSNPIKNNCCEVESKIDDLVDTLLNYQFAMNPNDESNISEQAKKSQEPLKAAGITVLDSAIDVVNSCKNLVTQDPSEKLYSDYSSSCKDLNDSLKHLTTTIRDCAPGQKECDQVLKLLEKLLRQVQETKIKLLKIRSKSKTWDNDTEESYQKVLESALRQMPQTIDLISYAGKREPEHLAHNLSPRLCQLIESISNGCLEATKHTELVQNSTIYLEHLSTILEVNVQYLKAIKKSGGNPHAAAVHEVVDEMAQGVKDSCEDLLAALDKISQKEGPVEVIVETITQSSVQAQQSAILPDNTKFANTQSRMLELCYRMDNLTEDISQSATEPSQQKLLSPLTVKLTQNYEELCQACQSAISSIKDVQKSQRLQIGVQDVGKSSVSLVKSSSDCKPNVSATVAALQAKAKDLHQRIDEVIRILIDANNQTQKCNEILKILERIKKDVDSAKIFLNSDDQLTPTNVPTKYDNQIFNETKKSITTHCPSIVNCLKSFVLSNPQNRDLNLLTDKMMDIAVSMKKMSQDLLECTDRFNKWSRDDKIELLDAFNDIDLQLIKTTEDLRELCEKPSSVDALESHSKDSVTAITKFLKLFKELEDHLPKDYEIIDETIIKLEEYYEEITSLVVEKPATATVTEEKQNHNPTSVGGSTTSLRSNQTGVSDTSGLGASTNARFAAEELSRLLPVLSNSTGRVIDIIQSLVDTKPMGDPESGLVSITTIPSHEDIVAVTKHSLKVNSELKSACRNLLKNQPANENQLKTVDVASKVTDKYTDMLKNLKKHLQSPTRLTQNEVISSARQCSDLIKLLYQYVESLREGPKLVMYFRPSSPEWRDVSEKYIGRHVAYHHCYIKSYKHSNTHTSVLHHQSPLLIPINKDKPTTVDLDKAKKQVRYVTTKLVHIQPNKNLIGKDKHSVAEIDQMISYIRDIGQSTECLISSSQSNASTNESNETLFKSALKVADAMKNLCDVTKSALLVGSLNNIESGIPEEANENDGDDDDDDGDEDSYLLNPISKATKEISKSTQKLLESISVSDKIKEYGSDIQKKADLLLNHMACIGGTSSNSINNTVTNGDGSNLRHDEDQIDKSN